MMPLIHAKFRKRKGVPYSIEQLSGRQFRCRHCNQIFYQEKLLDAHIQSVLRTKDPRNSKVDPSAPEPSTTVDVRLLYTQDIKDRLQRQWLRLRKGDQYDGV